MGGLVRLCPVSYLTAVHVLQDGSIIRCCTHFIHSIDSGAIVVHREPVREVAAYAQIFVQLSEDHTLDDQWRGLCDQVDKWIDEHVTHSDLPLRGLNVLLKKRVQHLRSRIARTDRVRRGLFDFVGDIASSLFGIPSAEDIRSLKHANKILASEMEGVVTSQRKVIAKVNMLGRRQQEIASKVNEIVEHQKIENSAIQHFYALHTKNTFYLRYSLRAIRVSNLIGLISENLLEYEESLATAQALRVSCESRIVTEQLLPTHIVHQLLSKENHQQLKQADYYAYIKVTKITEFEGQVYCVLQAPMFSSDNQQQVNIVTQVFHEK